MSTPAVSLNPEPSLWRNPAFVRLWISKAVSGVGTAITGLAIPLTAVKVLDASPTQMAMLIFAGQLPDLVFGLLAGAWVDRVRRRPLLVSSDLLRALFLITIPIAAWLGFLSIPLLLVVAFVCASFSLIFTLASVAILPTIVKDEQLVDANSKLHMTDVVTSLAGPPSAGFLIGLVSAPRAIIADAFSFIVSALALGKIGDTEAKPAPRDRGLKPLLLEIREGTYELIRTPLLRALAFSMGIFVIGGAMSGTVMLLYLDNVLHLSAFQIGLTGAFAGLGGMTGAAFASRAATWFTLGGAIILSGVLEAAAFLATPLASSVQLPLLVLATTSFGSGIAVAVLGINQMSLRQRITPNHLLGRVTAARRFMIFCMGPFGALLGGILGTRLGYEPTILIAGLVVLIGTIYMWFSPIRTASI